MKQCNQCKATFDDAQQLCPACGCADATVIEEANAQPQETQTEQIPTETPYPPYDPNLDIPTPEQNNGNGNILAGVVGAFLFSIIGGILYFIVYQAGFVAGICGLVMFVLANFGYKLFAQTKNKASIPGLIASIAAIRDTVLYMLIQTTHRSCLYTEKMRHRASASLRSMTDG